MADVNVRRYDMGRLKEGALPGAPEDRSLTLGSTAGLRAFLLLQMQRVAAGSLNHDQVKSLCLLSEQIYKTAKLEIDYAREISKLAPGSIGLLEGSDE